jgi:hypothetical protein
MNEHRNNEPRRKVSLQSADVSLQSIHVGF